MNRVIAIHPLRPAPVLHPPQLRGESESLQRVIGALQAALNAQVGLDAPANAWLRALRLEGDEAELSLAPGLPHCGVEIAQAAFDTLKGLLPDTDIYVRTAAH